MAVCCNGNGSDKLPLFVIGKSKSPRCFKNINLDTIGCKYRNNIKAWMTQAIFNEWLKSFDARMAGRQVLLIMNYCSAHIPLAQLPTVIRLRNTTVFYLPPSDFETPAVRRRHNQEFEGLLSQALQSLAPSAPRTKCGRSGED